MSDVPEIDITTLEQRLGEGVLVVDVREDDEYPGGHVAGAVLMPLGLGARSGGRAPRRRARSSSSARPVAAAPAPCSSSGPRGSTPPTSPVAPGLGQLGPAGRHRLGPGLSADVAPDVPVRRHRQRLRGGHRRPSGRPGLRPRHRVPPRAHLLPEARPRAAGLAGRAGARRPARRRHGAVRRDPAGPGHRGAPRRRPGPRDPRAGVRHGARHAVRHPGRRRLHRAEHAVARHGVREAPRA